MSEQDEETALRKVQAYTGERSLTVVLAKVFANRLGIEKGDFLKCSVNGQRLVVEKVDA